ncbi:hypothetical protein EYF80_007300 [Liparis tanakae]|uniref:Uncharacterized protein n=1 Tax=Liparis tanakae TaxID=230148 RepID=A0A4Z2IWX0_9TELE|nr:hypothetical protein EYF80_007300 [Liparis tanakae]
MEMGRRSTAHTATDRVKVHSHSLGEGKKTRKHVAVRCAPTTCDTEHYVEESVLSGSSDLCNTRPGTAAGS